MKIPALLGPVLACAALPAMLFGAGYSNDFSTADTTGWGSDNQYQITASDGALQIDVNKSRPWAGFVYNFDSPLDLTATPYVSVAMKGNQPFTLMVYLKDADSNTHLIKRVFLSDEYQEYLYDFTGATGVDLNAIETLIFAVNGAALSFEGNISFDSIRVGDAVTKHANVSGVPDATAYQGKTGYEIRLSEIENATSIDVGGPYTLIENVQATAISNGVSLVTFDAKSDASGTEVVTLTAKGTSGFADNAVSFDLAVEENIAPTIGAVDPLQVLVNESVVVDLSGISDGNPAANQALSFEATAASTSIIPGAITVDHTGDSSVATLSFMPETLGSTTIDLTVTDDGTPALSETISIEVNVYDSINEQPVVDAMSAQVVVANQGNQSIVLTGIHDGDEGLQNVEITAVSSNADVIANPITVQYDGGDTATLVVTPNAENLGETTITVTLTDDGAAEGNNGNAVSTLSFKVETVNEPLTGFTATIDPLDVGTEPGQWRFEGLDTEGNYKAIVPSIVQKDGQTALKMSMVAKSTWDGVWLNVPDLDLTENPSISFDIFFESASHANIATHVYFWDDNTANNANGQRNADGAHNARQSYPVGVWRTFAVNYNNVESGLLDGDGAPINTARIQRLLFNFHPSFGWPFTNETFTVYLRNIRVGDQAQVSAGTPTATINPVPAQVHFTSASATERFVSLAGISNGAGGPATLTVQSSNTAVAASPTLSSVTPDGTATLTYTTGATTGQSTITVTANANGSNSKAITFKVDVVANEAASRVAINVDRSQTFQKMYGFGTFSVKRGYKDLYTTNLGASAMRLGFISNQLETVNDNNDPYVLNRDTLNLDAIDWQLMREYREAGVETFILTSWSPPAWMKENLSENYFQAGAPNYENTDNRLDPYFYQEYAEMFVATVRLFKEKAGIDLAAIGPQNEPAFNEPYASGILSPVKFAELIAVIGKRFEDEGIQTRIFMPEQVFSQGHYSMAEYMTAVRNNADANKYTDIIATHGYASDGVGAGQPNFSSWSTMWSNAQQGTNPKELWMTETFPQNNGYDSAINYAMFVYGAVVHGNVGLWTSWSIEDQLISVGTPLEQFYTFKNYSKYVRPGAMRVAATSADSDVYVSAFEHTEDETLTLVVVNLGTTPKTIEVGGENMPSVLRQYTTSENRNFANLGAIETGVVLLPARSVTTLTGSVAATGDAPVITSVLTAAATELSAFSYTITADNDATSFAATGLPTGLVIDSATGVISGSPADGSANTYNVTITATNGFGSDSETLVITVAERVNSVPTAKIVTNLTSGVEPLTVEFDGRQSTDVDGTIASYDWDFGDGDSATGAQVSHEFVEDGEYTVTLTVTDNDGGEGSITETIVVTMKPEFTFNPDTIEVAWNGGFKSTSLTTLPAASPWTAVASDPEVITFVNATGTGDSMLQFTIKANRTGTARTLEITIEDSVLTINQAAEPVVGPTNPWDSLPLVGGAWKAADIGWIADASFPMVYHLTHGWFYVSPMESGYMLYNIRDNLGWLWTTASLYPNVYSYSHGTWLFYLDPTGENGGQRWFFDYSDQTHGQDGWFTVPSE